jgi:hypothetical protein
MLHPLGYGWKSRQPAASHLHPAADDPLTQKEGFSDDDLNRMPIPEYVGFIQSWIADLR